MDGRILRVDFTGALSANYSRTDNALNPTQIQDIFNYLGLRDGLANGVEKDQADLFYHATRQYLATMGTETIDLDAGDLVNVFGDTLVFENIKCVIIKNNELTAGVNLLGGLHDEVFNIGPNGWRVIWEPNQLPDSAGSAGVAGILSLTSGNDVSYDLIVIGTSALVNLISSGS